MHVYLDNAATTPLDPEVLEEMMPFLTGKYGNPSSIHAFGRETRAAIEKSRRKIASLLHALPSEIFLTSGGTEANNTAIANTIRKYGLRHAITSPIEHHAVLHPLEQLEKAGQIELHLLNISEKGESDLEHLEQLLQKYRGSFVSLMHANNEIGNLNDIRRIGELCREYNSFVHSDTVQTVGHIPLDLEQTHTHFISGSAHKFHGPKGTGFLYINSDIKIEPLLHGGSQERNMRGGTENIAGIVGMTKALELAVSNLERDKNYILNLKKHFISKLSDRIPSVSFNGLSADADRSLYTIVNVALPGTDDNEMLLFNLDIHGIAASGGSACASGSSLGSHVLKNIGADPSAGHVRFSFSRMNTVEEIDYVVEKLTEILKPDI